MSSLEPPRAELELILKAQKSNCKNELRRLSNSQYSKVRRCVAKNINTPRSIINTLACDPVQNVSYIALKNPTCTIKRDNIDFSNKCVMCTKDEATFHIECSRC